MAKSAVGTQTESISGLSIVSSNRMISQRYCQSARRSDIYTYDIRERKPIFGRTALEALDLAVDAAPLLRTHLSKTFDTYSTIIDHIPRSSAPTAGGCSAGFRAQELGESYLEPSVIEPLESSSPQRELTGKKLLDETLMKEVDLVDAIKSLQLECSTFKHMIGASQCQILKLNRTAETLAAMNKSLVDENESLKLLVAAEKSKSSKLNNTIKSFKRSHRENLVEVDVLSAELRGANEQAGQLEQKLEAKTSREKEYDDIIAVLQREIKRLAQSTITGNRDTPDPEEMLRLRFEKDLFAAQNTQSQKVVEKPQPVVTARGLDARSMRPSDSTERSFVSEQVCTTEQIKEFGRGMHADLRADEQSLGGMCQAQKLWEREFSDEEKTDADEYFTGTKDSFIALHHRVDLLTTAIGNLKEAKAVEPSHDYTQFAALGESWHGV